MNHFCDTLNFISKLGLRKFYNIFLNRFSFFISMVHGKPIHWGAPVSASIEATTLCNLRCPECPSGLNHLSRPAGSIHLENFKKFLEPISKNLTYLLIYFQGEPYLNKHFFELVKTAASKKIYTATSTNGHFLDEENAHKTITSGLDRLIISLDGTDQESYSAYRKNGNFEKVIDGIKNIVAWKKKLNSKKPYIILQFLVLKSNEAQIDKIKILAKELGVDKLELKTAQFYEYKKGNPLMPTNTKYSRYLKNSDGQYYLKKKLRNHCLRMWQSMVITWDGKVVPCCFDKDADFILGDLNTNAFPEIWKGITYQAFRKKIQNQKNDIPMCCNCTE